MLARELHVEIDPSAGFCFGVKAAVRMADDALDKGKKLYCLGQLLHNEEENRRLESKGMHVIGPDDLGSLRGQAVMFRAHGEPPQSYGKAETSGVELIDGTCPVVKKLQERVKKDYQNGAFIILLGKPGHPEIKGINGLIDNQAVVVSSRKDIRSDELPHEVAVYCQTTLDRHALAELVNYLRSCGKTVRVHDTICRKVSDRIPLLKDFAAAFDAVLFVGGRNSSNAQQLFAVCKQVNPRSHFVTTVAEIHSAWFRSGDRIGITGGTSTPQWLMETVRDALTH